MILNPINHVSSSDFLIKKSYRELFDRLKFFCSIQISLISIVKFTRSDRILSTCTRGYQWHSFSDLRSLSLFVLLLFMVLKSPCQEVLITDSNEMYSAAVSDVDNRRMYYFLKDHYLTIDLNSMERISKPFTRAKDFHFETCYGITKNGEVYFLQADGGLVYKLKNDSIQRIDQSYLHKMQNGAPYFVHDNKLFRYGGYGFWSIHNIFTYFSDETREWEYAGYKDHKVEAPKIFSPRSLKTEDKLFLFNGLKLDPMNRIKRLRSNEVWQYSFTDQKWTHLGSSNWQPNRASQSILEADQGNRKYIFQDNEVFEIDPENNRLTVYKRSVVSKLGGSNIHMMYDDKIVYSYPRDNSGYMKLVPADQFIGEKLYETTFYTSSPRRYLPYIFYLLGAAGLFFLGKWLVQLSKKKKKVVILNNGLNYKNKFTECDQETMEILNLLLSAKRVPSSEILKIVEKEQFSAAHNERLKVQKINDLNIKLQTLFGEKEAQIRSVKSKEDKRIRVYTLDRTYF